jgi:hypothetical protein
MKKYPLNFLIIRILIVISFGVFSCSTDELKALKDALVAKIWRVNKVVQKTLDNGRKTVIFQKTSGIKPAIVGDDYWKMNYSFKIESDETQIYTYTDPRGKTHTGKWSFIENDSKIELKENNFSITNVLIIRNLDKEIFNYSEINGKVETIFEMK